MITCGVGVVGDLPQSIAVVRSVAQRCGVILAVVCWSVGGWRGGRKGGREVEKYRPGWSGGLDWEGVGLREIAWLLCMLATVSHQCFVFFSISHHIPKKASP